MKCKGIAYKNKYIRERTRVSIFLCLYFKYISTLFLKDFLGLFNFLKSFWTVMLGGGLEWIMKWSPPNLCELT